MTSTLLLVVWESIVPECQKKFPKDKLFVYWKPTGITGLQQVFVSHSETSQNLVLSSQWTDLPPRARNQISKKNLNQSL
jgi:hypothetical protein